MATAREPCVIEELLSRPFKSRPSNEMLQIVEKGRPTPAMPTLRPFNARKKYDRWSWLAGSAGLGALFCWPCLLFAEEKTAWNTSGASDPATYVCCALEHECTGSHVRSYLSLQTYFSAEMDARLAAMARHNAAAERKRRVLARFVDCLVYVVRCGLPLDPVRYHDSDSEDSEGYTPGRGNFLATLDFLGEFDPLLRSHMGVFADKVVQIRDGLVRAMAAVLRGKVRSELSEAGFVSLLLDEVQSGDRRLVRTVVRYVGPGGAVRERLVSARAVGHTAEAVFAYVADTVEELGVAHKVVAHCYDGTVLDVAHVQGLDELVRSKCPRALYVHNFAHDLRTVLTDSLSHVEDSRLPVFCLARVPAFFAHSLERCGALRTFLEREYPDAAAWDFVARPMGSTMALRKELLEYFDGLAEECTDFETRFAAEGCVSSLESFDGCFHLSLLSSVHGELEGAFSALGPGGSALKASGYRATAAYKALTQLTQGDRTFEAAWEFAASEAEEDSDRPRKRSRPDTTPRTSYRERFDACLQNVATQVTVRLDSAHRLRFVGLLDPRKFGHFRRTFPDALLDILEESYPGRLEPKRLRTELHELYALPLGRVGSVHELMSRASAKGLDRAVPEAYRLGCLCLALPCWPAPAPVKRWGRYGDRPGDLAHLRAETALLLACRDQPGFHDEVIEEFARGEGMTEFVVHTPATWAADKVRQTQGTAGLSSAPLVPSPSKRATPLSQPAVAMEEDDGPRSPVSMMDIKEETPFVEWTEATALKTEADDDTHEFAFVEVSGDPLSFDD